MPSKPIVACGLDVGSKQARSVVTLLEKGGCRLIGYSEVKSYGWNKGRISDPAAVSATIQEALRLAEQSAQLSIGSAVLGIGGATISGVPRRGTNQLLRYRRIDQSDINVAVERAYRSEPLGEDQMIIQLFPQDFTVDGHAGHRNPKGALGARLDAHVHLVTSSRHEHDALVGAANLAGIKVEETIYEAAAAAYVTVRPADRREGLALVDIGAHSSDLIVFLGEAVLWSTSIPVSGDLFTRDVARGFRVNFNDAERIKVEYGCASPEESGETTLIEVPSADGRPSRDEPRKKLTLILQARAEDLFDIVRGELSAVGMEKSLGGGLVLTGGGARLPGLCDVADQMLECESHKGVPVEIQDWHADLEDPAWATAAGLAMYSGRIKIQADAARKGEKFLRRLMG